MNYSDLSLPVPDFIGLPMVGLIAIRRALVAGAFQLAEATLLEGEIEGDEVWIVRPPVRPDCLSLSLSKIEHAEGDVPRIRKAVFCDFVSPRPWLFRVPYSWRLYTSDGPGSFMEWYGGNGLKGLKFAPQEIAGG